MRRRSGAAAAQGLSQPCLIHRHLRRICNVDPCSVDNVEPWMSGNARGPSTAFNLLYRLCQVSKRWL